MNNKSIRVLQVLYDFKKGGVQAEVMYPARILKNENVHFDVLLFSDATCYYESEFRNYGSIYRIPVQRKPTKIQRVLSIIPNYFFVKRELYKLLKSHEAYDAIHARYQEYAAPCIAAAKKAGIPVRIAHASINKPSKKNKDRLYYTLYLKLCAYVLRKEATHIFGVTESAVEYIAGKGNGIVIKNPTIALDRFNPIKYPNENTDGIIRLIMVGSYSPRKNQLFTIEVLRELCRIKPDSTLTLIGYPRSEKEDYINKMKQKIMDYQLEDRVIFLPQDSDIPLAMSRSTFLLMPSVHEGLPNVALEAQAMGLPCFISDDVSTDCDCGLCQFVSLEKGAKYWSNMIIKYNEEFGFEKTYPDMSEWDNRTICEEYLEYWRGVK